MPSATRQILETKVTTELYTLSELTKHHIQAIQIVWEEWRERHREDTSYVGTTVYEKMSEMAEAMQRLYSS